MNQHEPCTLEDLEVLAISDTEWRVGDRRRGEQSPEKVLGYIEQRGSTFDVLNVDTPGRHVTFPHLNSAIESFAIGARAT
ncbi:hypothetical protein [Cryobacterium sp. PH29-G1]|uniref:hypothetical protein n=1 Tax=Cryobacterium sp. PH29-G1 TaxID=3046211 RepID=UPI0024B8DFEA|nr:hypothetical protein [Cryobacterium sp. PH29-G1]MDJ0350575.1 hypothetical protein [Cryobacterium sp. PH29-G1]